MSLSKKKQQIQGSKKKIRLTNLLVPYDLGSHAEENY